MSDVGRYRKAYPRIWRHRGFRALSRDEQRLTLYLLCGPQGNRIGLFHFSIFTAAEDLDTTPQTLKKSLANVTVTFGWMFDCDAHVFYIPSWWKWNPPENSNVVRGSLKDLNEVPACALVDAFAANTSLLSGELDKDGKTLRGTFIEGLTQRLSQGSAIQNQDSVPEEQKQENRSGRAVRRDEASVEQSSSKLLSIARETLTFTSWSRPIEESIDTFMQLARHQGLREVKRADAQQALHTVRLEGRVQ